MPAHPVRRALIAVVRQRIGGFLHEEVIRIADVRARATDSCSTSRVTHRKVNTRVVRRRLAGGDYREGPGVIREKRIGIRAAVIEILIMHVSFRDSYCTLLTELEIYVRRDRESCCSECC